jgi:crossover junction endodeoxyribonuclease RuvC
LNGGGPLVIAGIDPGSSKTGYAFLGLEGGAVRAIAYGVIRAPRSGTPADRFLHIHRELLALTLKHRPREAAVEDIFHHKNVRSAFMLGQARGVAMLTLALGEVEIFSYPPAVIKKSVTAYGRADKLQVSQMVKAILGLTRPPPADAADALAVALTHAQTVRFRRLGLSGPP